MKHILMTAAILVCAWLVPCSAPAADMKPPSTLTERDTGFDLIQHNQTQAEFGIIDVVDVHPIFAAAIAPPRTLGAIVLGMCLAVVGAWLACSKPKHRWRALVRWCERAFGPPGVIAANIGELTHDETITLLADATSSTRYLLVTVGSDANHYAINGIGNLPIGTQGDEPAAIGDEVVINLLGKGSTKKMIASEAMATTGVPVYAAAAGKIALSGAVKVGTLLSAGAADGSVVEVADCPPVVSGVRTLTGATTLTAADSGTTFFLNAAGGFDITLPALATVGFYAKFIVLTAPTTAYTVTGATADKIVGHVLSSSGGAEDAETTAGGDVVNFVANTAVIGDQLEITTNGTLYFASARCAAAGGITITG